MTESNSLEHRQQAWGIQFSASGGAAWFPFLSRLALKSQGHREDTEGWRVD